MQTQDTHEQALVKTRKGERAPQVFQDTVRTNASTAFPTRVHFVWMFLCFEFLQSHSRASLTCNDCDSHPISCADRNYAQHARG